MRGTARHAPTADLSNPRVCGGHGARGTGHVLLCADPTGHGTPCPYRGFVEPSVHLLLTKKTPAEVGRRLDLRRGWDGRCTSMPIALRVALPRNPNPPSCGFVEPSVCGGHVARGTGHVLLCADPTGHGTPCPYREFVKPSVHLLLKKTPAEVGRRLDLRRGWDSNPRYTKCTTVFETAPFSRSGTSPKRCEK